MNRFSVIITTHDRPDLLARAVRSVKAQEGVAVEVIVVADRFCAATQAVLAPLLAGDDLFIQRSGAPGPAASRNVGMRTLTSDSTLFLDDDDEFAPGFLSAIGPVAARAPGAVLFSDFSVSFDRYVEGRLVDVAVGEVSLASRSLDDVHVKNFIPNSCLLYPTKALADARFDPGLALNEDWEFILNLLASRPFRHVPLSGPVIHKREGDLGHRGNTNDHLLLETYRTVYRRWPAPTRILKEGRRALLRSAGFEASLDEL